MSCAFLLLVNVISIIFSNFNLSVSGFESIGQWGSQEQFHSTRAKRAAVSGKTLLRKKKAMKLTLHQERTKSPTPVVCDDNATKRASYQVKVNLDSTKHECFCTFSSFFMKLNYQCIENQ